MSSLKTNVIYSSILSTSNYIFPLIIYPYISRILGVTNIGLCDFVDSIINYFILFSMMGIGTLGIREIASCGHNKEKIKQKFNNLFFINGIATTFSIIILIICIFSIEQLRMNSRLMMIGVLKLFSNFFIIEWFFKGLEDFKFITKRTLIVRSIFCLSVFIFVRDASDYSTYYFLTALRSIVLAIVSILYCREYFDFSKISILCKIFVRPFLILGIYSLMTSMYTTFNVAFLGFASDDTQVGYYTTATKLYTIILSLYTALTTAMMPRMSALIAEGKIEEFKQHINKSSNLLFSFSIPIIIIVIFFAPTVIMIISGKGYEGAITPMRIIMPLMLIIGIQQILVLQSLIPLKKDSIVLRNSIIGAALGITLNFLIVTRLQAVGSAIVWITCEIIILILSTIAVKKIINWIIPVKNLFILLLLYLPLIIIFHFIHEVQLDQYIKFGICIFISIIYFIVLQLYMFKTSFTSQVLLNLIIRISKFKTNNKNL